MKFLKKNLKLTIPFIVGVILASGIAVYATTYRASDISYTNNKNVAGALNDLYNISSTYKNLNQTTNATANDILTGKTAYDNSGNLITGTNNMTPTFGTVSAYSYQEARTNNPTVSFNLNRGKYLIIVGITNTWIAGGNSAVGEPWSEQWCNFTCTNDYNLHFIDGRECQTGSVGTSNLNTELYEEYYSLDISSNSSTITIIAPISADGNVGYILNATAIPVQ